LSGRPDTGLVTGTASEHNFCVGTGLCWTTPPLYQANIAARSDGGTVTPLIYFDVTGPPPNGVVYNDGAQDFLISTSNA
jgi:hypothetical protein